MPMAYGKKLKEYLAISSLPEEAGTRTGKVLVCGSGHTLWDDMSAAGFVPSKWKQNFDIIAVNRAVMDIPAPVDFVWSNHMDMMLPWVQGRDVAYKQKDKSSPSLHSNREYTRTTVWPFPGSGTSTLNAVMLAVALGYDDIKVCGAPMDNGPHYYDAPWFTWNHFEGPTYRDRADNDGVIEAANNNGLLRPWLKFLQQFKDIVEPMSGNPRELWLSVKE